MIVNVFINLYVLCSFGVGYVFVSATVEIDRSSFFWGLMRGNGHCVARTSGMEFAIEAFNIGV